MILRKVASTSKPTHFYLSEDQYGRRTSELSASKRYKRTKVYIHAPIRLYDIVLTHEHALVFDSKGSTPLLLVSLFVNNLQLPMLLYNKRSDSRVITLKELE
jgi:hypothetical protein